MKTELLAPAASLSVCEAVLAAGADAVYLGGDRFSARALAPNLSEDEIKTAIDLAHLYGRRIYLAVNTLLKNTEISRALYRYLKPLYEYGLDAIIVQDYGVFQFVKRFFPDLPIHCSTQMSVASARGAAWLETKGAARVIPARELTLAEIGAIHERTDLTIECFVHGALCYSYSGQCLLSSLLGGRSGNRGRCAQPCRLPYRVGDEAGAVSGKETYPLSLKDLCALPLIPQMCGAGVTAFKIEGRMKSLAYAAGVTRIYRAYLDRYERDPEHYAVLTTDWERLLALGNRSGFTRGYYEARPDASMLSGDTSSHRSNDAETVYEPVEPAKIPVVGRITLCPGQPMTLTVSLARHGDDGRVGEGSGPVTVRGDAVQTAKQRPLREEEIRAQLTKTGDTAFAFSSLTVEQNGACFVPLGQLNALRRAALSALTEEILRPARRTCVGTTREPLPETAPKQAELLNVMVSTPEQLEAALAAPFVDAVSLDLDADRIGGCFDPDGHFLPRAYQRAIEEARARIAAADKRTGYCFPYIFRDRTASRYEDDDWKDMLARFDRLWVRSYDSLAFAFALPGVRPERICLDHGIPVFSDETYRAFAREGIGAYTASLELNGGELAHMPNARAELILYGDLPVMISAQCIDRNGGSCAPGVECAGRRTLVDRYDNGFPVKKVCPDCYTIIYNSRPLSLFHRAREIRPLGFGSYRICLGSESGEESSALLSTYERAMRGAESVEPPDNAQGFTNGHFRRGVE